MKKLKLIIIIAILFTVLIHIVFAGRGKGSVTKKRIKKLLDGFDADNMPQHDDDDLGEDDGTVDDSPAIRPSDLDSDPYASMQIEVKNDKETQPGGAGKYTSSEMTQFGRI